ncbi:energy transducer TonB [Pseudogulbenkiania subflava]|uniref:Protein TonB n=1 Tax=Pseudogulbenkiania subflava DSM 22618 TaxID=1123014 RepID=A0A1Y6C8C0_9NEIS|nr:energy transducer TonB [Pseudogulbenkiania subflava]SMF51340.1 protein TonB [Pseudogulbenkiania subflava DSM 22618]
MNSRTERFAALSGVTLLHVAALAGLILLASQRVPITPPQLARMELVSLAAPHPATPAPAVQAAPRPEPRPRLEHPAARRSAATSPPLLSTSAPRPSAATPSAAPSPSPSPAPEEHRSEAAATASNAAPAKTAEAADAPITPPLYRGGYLDNPKPRYPALSLELNETGTVRVRVQVSAEGRALDVSLAQSSGYPRLDRAALEAVRQWRFVPARRGQEAIPFNFIVPVDFSIKSH